MNMPLLRNQAALQKSVERLNRWQSTSFINSPSYAVFTYSSDPVQSLTANVIRVLQWDYLYYNSDLDTNIQTSFFLYPPPTTQIYIPQEGMYVISLSLLLSVAGVKRSYLYVNGTQTQVVNDSTSNTFVNCTFQRYLLESDIVEIGVVSTIAANIVINALGEADESPLLSIKKL